VNAGRCALWASAGAPGTRLVIRCWRVAAAAKEAVWLASAGIGGGQGMCDALLGRDELTSLPADCVTTQINSLLFSERRRFARGLCSVIVFGWPRLH